MRTRRAFLSGVAVAARNSRRSIESVRRRAHGGGRSSELLFDFRDDGRVRDEVAAERFDGAESFGADVVLHPFCATGCK